MKVFICYEGFPVEFMINKDLITDFKDGLKDGSASIPAMDPDTTILNMLRSRGLVGTKEGCASGDCGACTVMVGEANPEGVIEYRSVNACISLAGSLANKHLVTVEGLAQENKLHPAQQAMINSHGSQCGFCTPGFVVSLATLVEHKAQALSGLNDMSLLDADQIRTQVMDGISGNLCRCTGYRPIIEAGVNALTRYDALSIANDDSVAFLKRGAAKLSIQNALSKTTQEPGAYLRPNTQDELDHLVARFGNKSIVAGCTDFSLEITQRWQRFSRLIDVTGVAELCSISTISSIGGSEDKVQIGAAVTYTDLEAYFAQKSPPFVHLLHRLGSRQIRNRGTLGGNIGNASPIADTPPVLLAWDAGLVIRSCTSGAPATEFELPIADFYQDYRKTVLQTDQYIAQIVIPEVAIGRFHRFYKHSKRLEDDISSVMGAFSFGDDKNRLTHARVAYGGMAAVPLRVAEVEALLISGELTDELIERACDKLKHVLTPMTDVRSSAGFRTAMAAEMLERALLEYQGTRMPRVDDLTIATTDETIDV